MKRRRVFLLILTLLLGGTACHPSSAPDIGVAQTKDESMADRLKLSVFYEEDTSMAIAEYDENATIQKMEEAFNIDFEFYHPSWGSESQTVGDMFSSGDFCDILYLSGNYNYKGGDEAAIEDGVYRDLTALAEAYMPNYYALISSDETLRRAAYNDDGKIVGLLVIPYDLTEEKADSPVTMGGLMVRKDWLEEAGLDVPVTYKDWEEMLTVFKDSYGCTQPFYMPGMGYNKQFPGFSAGLGAIPSMQMKDGKVVYGTATEGWKAYITLMADWYARGLIGAEYVVNDIYGIDAQACIREESGAMLSIYYYAGEMEAQIGGDAEFCAVLYPVTEEGQISPGKDRLDILGKRKIYVTTGVTDEELPHVLSFLDQLYDPETAFDLNYGVEGEDYIYNDAGKIAFTEKITGSGEYTPRQMMEGSLLPTALMGLKDSRRDLTGISEEEIQMCETWAKDGEDIYIPSVTLTAAEQEIYDRVMLDIEPYMKEMTNRMIVGASDIDKEWDRYIETIAQMGLEDAVKCYQDAYNRYMHR